jgi:hypothetical protein
LRLRLLIFRSIIVVWLCWLELIVRGFSWSKGLRFRFQRLLLTFWCEWLYLRRERGLTDLHCCGLRTGCGFLLWLEWLYILHWSFWNEWLCWRSESACGYLHTWCWRLRMVDLLLDIGRLGIRYLLSAPTFVYSCHTLSLWCWWMRRNISLVHNLILLKWLLLLLF